MATFTSAQELARAKKLHTYTMNTPRDAAPSASMAARTQAAGSVTPMSDRVSHLGLEHDKKRHTTDILSTPRRERLSQEPSPQETMYGHNHSNMAGPPYHKSCREFAHEKVEHLTPMFPASHAAAGEAGGPNPYQSNELFSVDKSKHKAELDGCSPQRQALASSPAEPTVHCSAERFRHDKMLHRHQIDGGKTIDTIYNGGEDSIPRCHSAEAFRRDKAAHRHEMDECVPKGPEIIVERDAENGQPLSVKRFSRQKSIHSRDIDGWVSRPEPPAPRDTDSQLVSNVEFSKKKANHHYTMEAQSPRRGEAGYNSPPPETNMAKSCRTMANEKKKHSKNMSFTSSPSGQHQCMSNEDYQVSKRKHRHQADSCKESRRAAAEAAENPDRTISLEKLNEGKRKHRHDMSGGTVTTLDRQGYSSVAPRSAHVSPRCSSYAGFSSAKRGHRHEMDECCATGKTGTPIQKLFDQPATPPSIVPENPPDM